MEQFLRQLQTIPEAAELIRRVEEGGCPAAVSGLQPVSYTHLDVYKRQALGGVTSPQIGEEECKGGTQSPSLSIREAGHAGQLLSLIHIFACSHLGKPKNGPDSKLSLAPVAKRLSELLGREVIFAHDVVGPDAQAKRCV